MIAGGTPADVRSRRDLATGVLFDLPEVAASASDAVADLPIETVGGSFFDGVPAGADLYFLRHVLIDWDDSHAAKILRNCRAGPARAHRLPCRGPSAALVGLASQVLRHAVA